MWDSLGFKESPYNTSPLLARAEDLDLLVGRELEATELCTNLGSAKSGIQVISGSPGVGKTSFFNVQQFKLENQLAPFGPKLLAARHLCPVQPDDDLKTLALRALTTLYRSVEQWCSQHREPIPPMTAKLGEWIFGTGSSGFSLGISIAGFGGSLGKTVQLPRVSDATFEAIGDAMSAIVAEVVTQLGFDSAVIALDNLENLDDGKLGNVLISLRDTLFSTPGLWWVLIGQSGLGSLIQSLDPRVFERTTGSGLEVKPIGLDELDKAISLRVQKFHSSGHGKSPLPMETHRHLFQASLGETRFVFKYSNSICTKFVERLRASVWEMPEIKALQNTVGFKVKFDTALNRRIAHELINAQVPHKAALELLRGIVEGELNGLDLKPKEKSVLAAIGDAGKARASDFKNIGLRSMQDFSSNYLSKFYSQHLLAREQEGRAVNYRLRGIALLAHSFGFLISK